MNIQIKNIGIVCLYILDLITGLSIYIFIALSALVDDRFIILSIILMVIKCGVLVYWCIIKTKIIIKKRRNNMDVQVVHYHKAGGKVNDFYIPMEKGDYIALYDEAGKKLKDVFSKRFI